MRKLQIAIKIRNLKKTYENGVTALKGVNLDIYKGEILAILGPNGAGKSTLIKILIGQIKPTNGQVFIFDTPIEKLLTTETRLKISYVPQENMLLDLLTVEENMDYFASLYDIKKEERKRKIRELLELFGLSEHRKKRAEKLSGGMKRKLTIATSLLNDPEILILDEPTTGLDPIARAELLSSLEVLKEKKKTIIITTHLIDEAEKLANRVAIMDEGKIIKVGKPNEIKEQICGEVLLDILLDTRKNGKLRDELLKIIKNNEFVAVGDKLIVKTHEPIELVSKLEEKQEFKDLILASSIRKPSLEDAFLILTGKKLE